MNNSNKIYRIEIGGDKFWVGAGYQLFRNQDMAIPLSFDEHLMVMDKINVEATAFSEEFNPEVHKFASLLMRGVK